jgi:hypothetical protein
VQKFTQVMPRLALQTPVPMIRKPVDGNPNNDVAVFSTLPNERPAKRLSYHTDFTANPADPQFRNPLTGRGPIEGRPPGEVFAHQRWSEFFPKVGYVSSWAGVVPDTRFHPSFPAQETNSVWTYGIGTFVQGTLPPPLIKGRYGEPILRRIYNNTPVDRTQNNASAATRRSCTSTTRTTARRATARPMSTTSPAPSTTTAGARRWPAATRSTPRRPICAPPGPTAMADWSMWRATSVSFRAPCGRTTTASSSPPRTSTRALSA